MNRFVICCLLFCLFLFLISCFDDKGTEPKEPYIRGRAYFSNASTHNGILVRIIQTGDSTYTDSYGHYRFDSPASDTCTVVASYESHISNHYVVIDAIDSRRCVPDLVLDEWPCTPRDSIPEDYPIGVRFKDGPGFVFNIYESSIGDSLFISAYEYYQPPNIQMYPVDTYDLWVISSLGDSEILPVYEYLGSIPEIWSFGYIIDSAGSEIPHEQNDIVEIEPSGGWVLALYLSYWMDIYVCHSHRMITE